MVSSQNIPNYLPSNGLLGWWPFNGNANDESGNGNHGIPSGAILSNDRFGMQSKAYNFDGLDDNIILSSTNNINFATQQSISFWIYFSSLPISESIVFSQQSSSSTSAIGYSISLNSSGKLNYRVGNGNSSSYSGVLNNAININQWNHLVCLFDSGKQEVYLNGQLLNSTLQPNAFIGFPNLDIQIGSNTWGSQNAINFGGIIDDVAIYNRSLTSNEILALYNGCINVFQIQPSNQNALSSSTVQFSAQSSDPSATYQWQTDFGLGFQTLNNAGQYSGTNTATLTISNVTLSNNNQNFRCISSSGSCVDTSSTATLIVNENVGIENQGSLGNYALSPNPASEEIQLEVGSVFIGKSYQVIDIHGRLVAEGTIESEKMKIDIKQWDIGIYYLKLGSHEGHILKLLRK